MFHYYPTNFQTWKTQINKTKNWFCKLHAKPSKNLHSISISNHKIESLSHYLKRKKKTNPPCPKVSQLNLHICHKIQVKNQPYNAIRPPKSSASSGNDHTISPPENFKTENSQRENKITRNGSLAAYNTEKGQLSGTAEKPRSSWSGGGGEKS